MTQKKNCSIYRVHSTQNDQLGLTVLTQQSVLKNMHRVQRYKAKPAKNQVPKPNLHIFEHFAGTAFSIKFCDTDGHIQNGLDSEVALAKKKHGLKHYKLRQNYFKDKRIFSIFEPWSDGWLKLKSSFEKPFGYCQRTHIIHHLSHGA